VVGEQGIVPERVLWVEIRSKDGLLKAKLVELTRFHHMDKVSPFASIVKYVMDSLVS
jgi:hypothetical protein